MHYLTDVLAGGALAALVVAAERGWERMFGRCASNCIASGPARPARAMRPAAG
jgi:membrane-associated phospholipid phosphatase